MFDFGTWHHVAYVREVTASDTTCKVYLDGSLEIHRQLGLSCAENEDKSGLFAYYDFNGESGSTLTDRTSGGRNGTLLAMEEEDWQTEGSPFTPYDPVGVNSNNGSIPNEFSLMQNYPNPFNPTTVINFALPKQVDVKLVVYNIVGEKVAELVNQNLNAGNYSVTFNALNFTSGIYIYRITAGSFVSVKKLMLLK